MLPGQGSQFRGMGRGLAREHPVFRATLEALSDLAEPETGVSLADMVFGQSGTNDDWRRVRLTHPLVVSFHYAWAKALESEGRMPDLWLGYSLGELTACALAGAIPIEDAVMAACRIGRLAEEKTPPASMMAVLAPVEMLGPEAQLFDGVTLACRNYGEHFVVAGDEPRLRQIRAELNRRDVTAELIGIDRGFHSDLICPIRPELAGLIAPERIGPLRKPVLSCSLGRLLAPADLASEYLWRIHHAPVEFERTVLQFDPRTPYCWVDLSATGTLAALAKRLAPPGEVLATLSPFGPSTASLERLKNL